MSPIHIFVAEITRVHLGTHAWYSLAMRKFDFFAPVPNAFSSLYEGQQRGNSGHDAAGRTLGSYGLPPRDDLQYHSSSRSENVDPIF
jgi:hypothetical protein